MAAAAAETAVLVLLIACLPISARGSAGNALREYNEGKYQEALKDYNKLLESKKDDPRLKFNAGTAAYQSRQLDEALKDFSEALESPDIQMQQRAYYNLGNTLYRSGQQMQDAEKKQKAWEDAIKSYESATKLNQQDGDAKFNQEFVKKQLEELKKQQQQQNQSDKNSKQGKSKDQKDQDQQSQNKQDQQNQQSQQNQDKDKSKSEQNSQADNKDKEKSEAEKQKEREQQQAKDRQQQEEQKKDQSENQEADQKKEQSQEEAKREQATMAAGQMTPRQAQQMLDATKDDEHVFQLSPTNKNSNFSPSFKNW